MKPLLSAKQLTLRYFSIVAIAIVTVHYSVFELTTDDLELAFVQDRMNKISEYVKKTSKDGSLEIGKSPSNTIIELHTQGEAGFDPRPRILFGADALPKYFPAFDSLPFNKAVEVESEDSSSVIYLMKTNRIVGDSPQDFVILIDNSLYELNEEQLLAAHTKQIVITLLLMLLSLLVVIQISRKLSLPISIFSKALSSQNPAELNLLSLPKEALTKELESLVSTFNQYQTEIQQLIERERSFNRYASHELRSPLMVMKGAITLMGESSDKTFLERQMKRLDKSASDMSEFVETLLSLTAPDESFEKAVIAVDKDLVESIVESYEYLLENKPVTWRVNITELLSIKMPGATFHILLGNLIKNAFAYTDQGEIVINVSSASICVIDTGKGVGSNKVEGYGLGLLLVRDISRRFGGEFEISSNNGGGSIATLTFSGNPSLS